jgi:DNA helicase-2/ATP-dependent DNA helicase PcrA
MSFSFTAADIATILAADSGKVVLPTPEQSTVIEQPLGQSVLVVAGAGSGKTETMANRVVWLVANGLAEPSQVLGLTFTRKAAGELGERVVDRLQRFLECLTEPAVHATLTPAQAAQAQMLEARTVEGLHTPEVSTYNAYASAVVREFGAFAGLPSGGEVIDAATAWGLARDIVCTSEEPGLAESGASIGLLVKHIITLDHAVADNLTTFDHVVRHLEAAEHIGDLPYSEKKTDGQYAVIDEVMRSLQATRMTVRLAQKFSEEKRRRGLLEFSDQLALAVETLRRSPDAVRSLRRRTPVVLLDEVQDTSVGQTVLLSTLFAGSSVMAVGDPHQSIYGFRGASASNLQSFHRDFRAPQQSAHASITLNLSTSWRNPSVVLRAANRVSEPLASALAAEHTSLTVKPLTSRAEYLGNEEPEEPAQLEVIVEETVQAEYDSLATWMREARNEHLSRTGDAATAAVIFRSRKHMPAASAALWKAGVPNRIVGLGGLLSTPEVTDLVCALRCLWFADANNELLRLLAGPRFRVGSADLAGLADAARWFSKRDHAKQPIEASALTTESGLPITEQEFTLLDALDEIAAMNDLNHRALKEVSAVGRARLQEAAVLLQNLRREVGADILTLLRTVTHALLLDIELDSAEHTGYHGGAVARANLDAFSDLVAGFLATDERGTLFSVLTWLERATEDDEPAEHVPEPETSTVQLITVHGSKGLEWDLVAVPRLVDGEFPATPREGRGWLRPGQLPDDLRGDRAARPRLNLDLADTQQQVRDAIVAYQDALKDRFAQEERRLAYVAMTRAASRLLLTCSFWGGQKQARQPAIYLRELSAAQLIGQLPESSNFETDPTPQEARTQQWPLDPLGQRQAAVHRAADTLRAALAQQSEPNAAASVHPMVRLLLAERDTAQRSAAPTLDAVDRLTASTFHEYIEDPSDAERRRLRPMPVRPYRRTRVGNLFHDWVERRASTALGTTLTLAAVDDALNPQLDPRDEAETEAEHHEDELQQLIEQFEQSRWASLQPLAVELEITLPFAGSTLVCKLDAIYAAPEDSPATIEIVDWKSGASPQTEAERVTRFLQLDLYRHAYAQWSGIAPELIEATLFYVAEGKELTAQHTRSLQDLETLWLQARDSTVS